MDDIIESSFEMLEEENESSYIARQHEEGLEALLLLQRICSERDIQYYLLAGSCLGAVRHNGFIPWDDDIDIGILDEEYESFRQAMIEGLSGSKYEYRDRNTSNRIPRMYGKIIRTDGHAVIDCFRLVSVPDNVLLQVIQWNMRKVLRAAWSRKAHWGKRAFPNKKTYFAWRIKGVIVSPLTYLIPEKTLIKMLLGVERFPGKRTKYKSNFYSIYSRKKELIPIKWLDHAILLKFEGGYQPVPNDYDAYLTKLYGDYMTPPKDAEIRLSHILNVYKSEE